MERRELSKVLIAHGGPLRRDSLPKVVVGALDDAGRMLSSRLRPIVIPGPPGYAPLDLQAPSESGTFDFVEQWDVNAFAVLADKRPAIVMHAGTPLFLIDAFNAVLCYKHILPDLAGHEAHLTSSVPLPPLVIDRSNIRLWSYPDVPHFIPSIHSYVSLLPTKPQGEARPLITSRLFHFALLFIFQHEYAHIAMGHISYLAGLDGTDEFPELRVNAARKRNTLGFDAFRAMEIEADHVALTQLIAIALEQNQKHHRLPDLVHGSPSTIAQHVETLLFSVGMLLLLFEYCERTQSPSEDHPSPRARLLALLLGGERICSSQSEEIRAEYNKGAQRAVKSLSALGNLLNLNENLEELASRPRHLMLEIWVALQARNAIESEIERARDVTKKVYFLGDRPVSELEYYREANPVDEYLLQHQRVERKRYGLEDFVYEWKLPNVNNPSDFVTRGVAYCKDGQFVKATRDFRLAIEIDNLCQDAFRGLVLAHLLQGEAEPASRAMASLDALAAINPEIEVAAASKYLDERNFHSALVSFSLCVFKNPELIDETVNLGVTWHLLGRSQEAISVLDSVLAKNRNLPDVWINRGSIRADLGEFDAAFSDFEEAFKIDPQNEDAWINKGVAAARNKQMDVALTCFDRVVQLRPHDPLAYRRRAGALVHLERFEEALADLSIAVSKSPEDITLFHAIAETQWRAGKLNQAIETATAAIYKDADDGVAHKMRAQLNLALKRYQEAAQDAIRSIDLGQGDVESFRALVRATDSLGDAKNALEYADSGVIYFPNDNDLLIRRADLRFREGHDEQAINDLTSVLGRDAKNMRACLLRSQIWRKKGESQKALDDLGAAISAKPDSALLLTERASLLLDKQSAVFNPTRAREDLLEACRIANWADPRPLELLSIAFSLLGDRAEAKKFVEQAILLADGVMKDRLAQRLTELKSVG